MNIKISKAQHDRLQAAGVDSYLVGSYLYGTNTETSDKDYLCIYNINSVFGKGTSNILMGLPNIHQFQYTENNTDYLYTSYTQFWCNFYSGDSTINVDAALFVMFNEDDRAEVPGLDEKILKTCRSYNIIKAFIGFAKRDIKIWAKNKSDKKLFHIYRGFYMADCLLKNVYPQLDDIRALTEDGCMIERLEILNAEEERLRTLCNTMFDNGELLRYNFLPVEDDLLTLLLESNNTKEFKY